MAPGVPGRARRAGPYRVPLHPLLAAAQPLEVQQGAPDPLQGLHLPGKSVLFSATTATL